MKQFEILNHNIKKDWPDHPTRAQLSRVELSTLDESELFNSLEFVHSYSVNLDGIHVRIIWIDVEYGSNAREAYRIVGFLDSIKIAAEFISWKDQKIDDPREIIEAFCFGR